MDPIRYYDIRYVRGNSTTIVVENGTVESAGSNFFGKALVRVLGEHGWGYYCASPFDPDDQTANASAVLHVPQNSQTFRQRLRMFPMAPLAAGHVLPRNRRLFRLRKRLIFC